MHAERSAKVTIRAERCVIRAAIAQANLLCGSFVFD
jgi:hypothetical protein